MMLEEVADDREGRAGASQCLRNPEGGSPVRISIESLGLEEKQQESWILMYCVHGPEVYLTLSMAGSN